MKWLLSCFLTILLLFEGATSSDAGPVRLIPLQYWRGTPEQPTEADSCSQEVTPKSGQETLGIYFNLFKGERGYVTLGDEETLKKQAAECLRPGNLGNFSFKFNELQFTFPLSQDARCVMWFVLAMRRSGLRYTLDTKTKTFNISLHVSTKGKGCAAHALPTSGDKFRFCIVKKCDSENAIPFTSEQHVIHDSRAITPNTNLDDFCDLECRYESYQIKEAANGAQIVVKPKKGYTTLVINPPGTTEDVQRAGTGQSWYQVATVVCVVFLLAAIITPVAVLLFMDRKIPPMMTRLREVVYPQTKEKVPENAEKKEQPETKEKVSVNAEKKEQPETKEKVPKNAKKKKQPETKEKVPENAEKKEQPETKEKVPENAKKKKQPETKEKVPENAEKKERQHGDFDYKVLKLKGAEEELKLKVTRDKKIFAGVQQEESNFQELHTGDRILTFNNNPVHGKSGKDAILNALKSKDPVNIQVERPITQTADLLMTKNMHYRKIIEVSPQPLRTDACEIGKRQSAKPVAKAEKSILKKRGSRSNHEVDFSGKVKVYNMLTEFTNEDVDKWKAAPPQTKKRSPEEQSDSAEALLSE
ncbi:hypothetical protein QR680_018809 [Steinernema hermaphroditum]|uniref:PDZ domain-containing protein n=1 Tax=Steinernema hermaphroditum TaxID=289476 RepID=A0AA39HJ28_9BILA|nr:hypothetical protein QR680_018809 [Steinernema hermaphroditum]